MRSRDISLKRKAPAATGRKDKLILCPETTSKRRRRASRPAPNKLSTRKLLSLRDRLVREEREAAHAQSMENILKNPEVQMRGVVQIDESLQAYRRQVEKEIESRTKRGDPVIYATANKKLKADFRVVREAEIMDDLLKDVSPPPVPLPVALPVEPHNKPEEQPAIPPAIVTDAAKIEPARNAPRPAVELTDHEEKVWEVIQRGSKGRTYCRELDNANIQPRRDGVWKDGPHKYVAAYDLGQPWRHRIEDEKSKIRRKAKAAKPAGALASE